MRVRAVVGTAGFVLKDLGTQTAEFVAVLVAEFGEPGGGLGLEFGMNGLQQSKPLGGDVGYRLALVVAAARAPHQAAGLQAVHEPGDVGCALHHALGDFTAGMSLGMYTPQNSQNVVLRTGKSMTFTNLVEQVIERAGRHRQAEYGFLLRIGKARLFQSPAESFSHGVCYSQK